MVQINYVDGDTEVVETVENEEYVGHYRYEKDEECFVVFDKAKLRDCMRISREFVKSIRIIETE